MMNSKLLLSICYSLHMGFVPVACTRCLRPATLPVCVSARLHLPPVVSVLIAEFEEAERLLRVAPAVQVAAAGLLDVGHELDVVAGRLVGSQLLEQLQVGATQQRDVAGIGAQTLQ